MGIGNWEFTRALERGRRDCVRLESRERRGEHPDADWGAKDTAETIQDTPQVLKKTLKEMVEKLSPQNALVKEAVQEVVSKKGNTGLNRADVKETVEKAVKEAVPSASRRC